MMQHSTVRIVAVTVMVKVSINFIEQCYFSLKIYFYYILYSSEVIILVFI